MNFTVQKANLVSAMDVAIRAIPSKSTMPLLYCFLIEVEGDTGYITSTDMGTSIRTRFSCMAIEDGKMCVEAKTLLTAVKKMGKADITFETDGNMVIVTGAKARYELPTSPVDDYPSLPSIKDTTKFFVDGDVLRSMIDGVSFSASTTEKGNKVLMGINLFMDKGKLRLTALDLIRVAIRFAENECDENVNVVVPLKTMVELSKSIIDEDVEVEVSKINIRFTFGNTTMIARLIDGNFFNVDQILRHKPTIYVKCNKKELMETVDRALVLLNAGDDKTPAIMSITDDSINISFQTKISKFSEDLASEKTGEDIRIGVNPAYLLDALKAADGDEVMMQFHNPNAPVNIVDDNGSYTYVIMPVNI